MKPVTCPISLSASPAPRKSSANPTWRSRQPVSAAAVPLKTRIIATPGLLIESREEQDQEANPPAFPEKQPEHPTAPAERIVTLFIDLNSFFARVEQQMLPALRGRPVAVVPVMTDTTCAIAASPEAKRFGIKTGTMIGEAKRLCPHLILKLARHDYYVDYHHRVVEEVNRHAPIEAVISIDEMVCNLAGWRPQPDEAQALARRIKQGILRNVGDVLTSSVGLASNRFLAKVASNMQKPDGLVWLRRDELESKLCRLELRDLPGIGHNMEVRLAAAGIRTMAQLWHAPPALLRMVWGGVMGERFWHQLHGTEIAFPETTRRTVGHSNVLAPEFRPPAAAAIVAKRLLLKAASRLRRLEHRCRALHLAVQIEKGPYLDCGVRFELLDDNFLLMAALKKAWVQVGHAARAVPQVLYKKVSITLHELVPCSAEEQLELFSHLADGNVSPEKKARFQRLSVEMDFINQRGGRDSIVLGFAPDVVREFSGPKIAFTRIPDAAEFRE